MVEMSSVDVNEEDREREKLIERGDYEATLVSMDPAFPDKFKVMQTLNAIRHEKGLIK